jgi:threonine dehydrogenase-like Zn-dependent dehydrogenase
MEVHIVELHGPRDLAIVTQSLDVEHLQGNQVAAETLFSAISPGTEVAAYRGDPPLRPSKVYPRVMGYCNVARIIAIGDSVTRYAVGDVILNFQSHRTAFICTEESIVARIPPDTDLEAAATTYLFHLGYNALLRGEFMPGMNVAVVGLGTLGITTCALAASSGGRVYAFSSQPESLELAHRLGCRKVFKKDLGDIVGQVTQDTDGLGIDIVVSTSNSWDDWRLTLQLARKGGKVCVIGFPGRTQPIPDFNPLDSQYFYDKQLALIACGMTPDREIDPSEIRFTIKRNCEYLLDLVRSGKLPARALISESVPWHQIQSVYETLSQRKKGYLTCVLRWQ